MSGQSFLELDFDPNDFEPMHPEELAALDLTKYTTYFLGDVLPPHALLASESQLVTMASGTSLRLLARAASDESVGSRAARVLHGRLEGAEDPDNITLSGSTVATPRLAPRPDMESKLLVESPPTAGSTRAWARSFDFSPRLEEGGFSSFEHSDTRPSVDVSTTPVKSDESSRTRRSSAPPQGLGRTRKDSLPRKVAQRLRTIFTPQPAMPNDLAFPQMRISSQ